MEEVHHGQRAEHALIDVVAEVGLTAEEVAQVSEVRDALWPVVSLTCTQLACPR